MDFARQLEAARARRGVLEDEVDELKRLEREAGQGLIDIMTVQGVGALQIEVDGIKRKYERTLSFHAQVVKAEEETAFAYLRSINGGDLIKPSVHYASLSKFFSELYPDGQVPATLRQNGINLFVEVGLKRPQVRERKKKGEENDG